MKAKHLIVAERPRLAAITEHPKVAFAEYERELRSMQFTVQAIQQAYLGTRERAVVVLEGWDAAGKGGIVRRLGWLWIHEASKSIRLRRRCRTRRVSTTFSAFGRASRPRPNRRVRSLLVRARLG